MYRFFIVIQNWEKMKWLRNIQEKIKKAGNIQKYEISRNILVITIVINSIIIVIR